MIISCIPLPPAQPLPVTSKKAPEVQGEMHSSAEEIFMGLLRHLGCSCYAHRSNLQVSRTTENKRLEAFLKGSVLFPVTQMIIFALLSFSFELLALIPLGSILLQRNRTGKVLQAAINGVDCWWQYLINVIKE